MNSGSIDEATASPTVTNLRSLVVAATRPLAPSERAVRARDAASELDDVVDLARLEGLLPGRVLDQIRAHRGDSDARARIEARAAIAEARAVAVSVPSDMPALIGSGSGGLVPGLRPISNGMPLIRQLADQQTSFALPLIPALPAIPQVTPLVGEIQTPGLALSGAATMAVDATVTPPRWATAVVLAEIANQVFDFAPDDSNGYLDQMIDDAVDRTAEIEIARLLMAGGTPATASAGANLRAYLLAAEDVIGDVLDAPADMVLVNARDLSQVRGALADSYRLDPHPTIMCSAGVPAGKVIVAARQAFVLVARPSRGGADRSEADRGAMEGVDQIGQMERPHGWSVTVATWRDFMLVVRHPGGIQVVTL